MKTHLYIYEDELQQACIALGNGGTILYPTDTVWGIGCDATDADAVRKVFAIKRRCDAKAMLVLLDTVEKLSLYVEEVPPVALELMAQVCRPLTIIYRRAKNLAENLTANDGSVGIRITKEEFSNALCRKFGWPIVSSSANISGETAPVSFNDVTGEILNGVDYAVRYRHDDKTSAMPSMIIRLEGGNNYSIVRE
ncbi:MAG: threonylcarbamoyl-AMP synthase [Tannerellaceae bacterium]|jgi:L-threonylcarbamoyladenylate synthase|nr:threonylcarbamoyl-AMP synthase [Tannerellaceae bacterium]